MVLSNEWVPTPFGLNAVKGTTVQGRRTVLAVAHNFAGGTRLAEVMPLLESDRRIQVAPRDKPYRLVTEALERHQRTTWKGVPAIRHGAAQAWLELTRMLVALGREDVVLPGYAAVL